MVAASADHSASDRGFVQRLAPYLAVGLLLAVVPIAFATASLEAEQINKHGEITRQATVSMTFVVVIGVLVAAFLSAGKAVTGRLLGVLIDERNKFSLSRLQIAPWTIVALASILSLAAALVWSDAENPLGFGIPTDLLVLTGMLYALKRKIWADIH